MGDNTVTIVFRGNVQPTVLNNVKTVDIKKDVVLVTGYGYRQVYFRDVIQSLNADYSVGVFIK